MEKDNVSKVREGLTLLKQFIKQTIPLKTALEDAGKAIDYLNETTESLITVLEQNLSSGSTATMPLLEMNDLVYKDGISVLPIHEMFLYNRFPLKVVVDWVTAANSILAEFTHHTTLKAYNVEYYPEMDLYALNVTLVTGEVYLITHCPDTGISIYGSSLSAPELIEAIHRLAEKELLVRSTLP